MRRVALGAYRFLFFSFSAFFFLHFFRRRARTLVGVNRASPINVGRGRNCIPGADARDHRRTEESIADPKSTYRRNDRVRAARLAFYFPHCAFRCRLLALAPQRRELFRRTSGERELSVRVSGPSLEEDLRGSSPRLLTRSTSRRCDGGARERPLSTSRESTFFLFPLRSLLFFLSTNFSRFNARLSAINIAVCFPRPNGDVTKPPPAKINGVGRELPDKRNNYARE